MDGNNLSIYDHQGRSRDACVGDYLRRWKVLSSLCPGVFFNMPDLATWLVRHATEVGYVRCRHEMLRTYISSDRVFVNFSCCYLLSLFSSIYILREVDW